MTEVIFVITRTATGYEVRMPIPLVLALLALIASGLLIRSGLKVKS